MYRRPQEPHGEGITLGFGFMAVFIGILGIISLFSSFNLALVNHPLLTLFGFQIWRIFTALIAMPDIITTIFTLLVLYMMSFEEYRVGSSRFILSMFFRNIFIQIGVVFFGLVVILLTGMNVISFSIWPVLILSITLRCLENPEGETNMCFGSLPIKNKYYPLALVAIFSVLSLVFTIFPVDLILGYLLGLWMNQNPAIKTIVDPSYKTVIGFEGFLRNLDGKLGRLIGENEAGHFDPSPQNFVPMQQMGNQQRPMNAGQQFAQNGQYFSPGTQPGGSPQQPFTGRGVAIGGSDVRPQWQQAPPPYIHQDGYPPQPYNQPMTR